MWLNHVTIKAPQNGTAYHSSSPSTANIGTTDMSTGVVTGQVVAGELFTPTAGRFLLLVVEGAATSGSNTSVPTAPPSGWSNGVQSVDTTGLYAFYKASAAGADAVTLLHNGSNFAFVFDWYEFPAGTTWVDGVGGLASNGGTGQTLTGLTGTNFVCFAAGHLNSNKDEYAISFTPGTLAASASAIRDSVNEIDGYEYGLAYIDEFTGSTAVATITDSNTFDTQGIENITFALLLGEGDDDGGDDGGGDDGGGDDGGGEPADPSATGIYVRLNDSWVPGTIYVRSDGAWLPTSPVV
jgi:hypothetical protein